MAKSESSFSRLSEHLANSTAASFAASLPPVQGSKTQEKSVKRKPSPASRGVEVSLLEVSRCSCLSGLIFALSH